MADVIDALGQAVMDYMHVRRHERRTSQEIADTIEIVMTPEQIIGLRLDADQYMLRRDASGETTFMSIPVCEIDGYAGPLIRPRTGPA